jgi:hypothetical protein
MPEYIVFRKAGIIYVTNFTPPLCYIHISVFQAFL